MILVCLVAVCWAAACDDSSASSDGSARDAGDRFADAADVDSADAPTVTDPSVYEDCAPYAVAGPNPVGVVSVEIGGEPVEVWYPAAEEPQDGAESVSYDLRDWVPEDDREKIPEDAPTTFETGAYRDVAIADGEHPVVIFSHGFAGYRMQSTAFTVHLASWGFVVASPEHPERGLAAVLEGNISFTGTEDVAALVATLDWLTQADADAGSFFEGRLAVESVGATGHSAGGRAALNTVVQDERIATVVGLAPALGVGGEDPTGVDARQVLVTGAKDSVVSAGNVVSYYDGQPAPKLYLEIAGAGHLAFSDICLIGEEEGGILQIAQDNGIRVSPVVATLARDGCRGNQLDPQEAWPIVHHFATAELRFALGVDDAPNGLDAEAAACFGGLVADFKSDMP
jgi:predicted dienelactone hydrolase